MKCLFYICCVLVVIGRTKAAVAPKGKTTKTTLKNTTPSSTLAPETTIIVTTEASTEPSEASTLSEPVTLPDLPLDAYIVPYYPREAWGARDPVQKKLLDNDKVPYIVVHDSGEPPMIEVAGCINFTECSMAMKNIQNQHMDVNGWWDIGYNFAIGGDGAIYEGRGWGVLGAQTQHFNTVSMGICFIGSYNKLVPTLPQMASFNALIATGIRFGFARPDYRLINHGQIKGTLCPGKKLSKKVLTLPHYSTFPSSLKDLLDIPEIPDEIKDEIRKYIVVVSDAL